MARHRSVAVALVALVGLSTSGIAAPDLGAASAAPTPQCEFPSGYAEYNSIPRSVADLIEHSEAVVAVRVTGNEKLVDSRATGGSTLYVMRSKARVDDVFKGDIEPSTNIAIHRGVIGYDLKGALAESVCMVGMEQALTAGSHYVIGLVHDDEARWHSAVGPYSTIPFRMRNGRLVAFDDCRVDVTDCDGFPYTLAGQTYGSLKAEVKAAAR